MAAATMSPVAVVLRTVLVCIVPVIAILVGVEPGTFILALSAASAVFEVLLSLPLCRMGSGKNKGPLRPTRFFPLQLAALYIVQLWWLTLVTNSSVPTIHRGIEAAPATPVASPAASQSAGNERFLALAQASAPKGRGANAPSLPPKRAARQPLAKTVPNFELDAAPDTLTWEPQTISVVLPCAEEREYAVKTVMSVFDSTPSQILHEIVVVDDGSEPPLGDTLLNEKVRKQYRVKIVRHPTTVGLIGAKKSGGDAASGDIVVFFDCHVAPQEHWYEDFMELIGENYRRMVVPQITALDVDTWTQVGRGGNSKCYVTWDGDFKWGGTDDMYMAMLSGGLAGLSKRWWNESGGFDDQMMGWGGENIDQGVRVWLCGGEIVAAPRSQVAHMWRTGNQKTRARYKHVGDSMRNRARAVFAWFGEFGQKAYDYPSFKHRLGGHGGQWYGDMSHFDQVKSRLQGCRPFAWYLRRFSGIYLDAGIVPPEIFMLKEAHTGLCLHFMGSAGTSSQGKEGVDLKECNPNDDRFYWHLGNRAPKTGRCCSGLRAWNTEQCFAGVQGSERGKTTICEISGRSHEQLWHLKDGQLRHPSQGCLGNGQLPHSLSVRGCRDIDNKGGARFTKEAVKIPLETQLYQKAQRDNPEMFRILDEKFPVDGRRQVPSACRNRGTCNALVFSDGTGRCLDDAGGLTLEKESCAPLQLRDSQVHKVTSDECLDSWSDDDRETWGFYGCHSGENQKFLWQGQQGVGGSVCMYKRDRGEVEACFLVQEWPPSGVTT